MSNSVVTDYRSPFTHVFDLHPNQEIRINKLAKIHYCGATSSFAPTAKFLIEAPQEVCIMRLEVFANNIQAYQTVLEVGYGDKISIVDRDLQMSFLPVGQGKLKVGIISNEKLAIKKSFFNELKP